MLDLLRRAIANAYQSMKRWLGRLFRRRQAELPPPEAPVNPKDLHVVAVYFNHHRFKNLRRNFERFRYHMEDLGVTLHIAELQLPGMPFEVTEEGNPQHIRLTSESEFFHKENLVNVAVMQSMTKRFPNWKYLAWIDADVTFLSDTIVEDTIRQLSRYQVVQMWGKAIDLGPNGEPLHFKVGKNESDAVVSSFALCYQEKKIQSYQYTTATTWHPGYAWAMRRSTWDALGGLLDVSILGAGDHHMAWAFAGKAQQGVHGGMPKDYKDTVLAWLYNAKQVVNGNLGYVPGTVLHHWHGAKSSRKYVERWDYLVRNKFEPTVDLIRRADGLLELAGNKPALRDDCREYLRRRNDDCNVTEDFFQK